MPSPLAATPEPPYWAVLFTSLRRDDDGRDYGRMAELMESLAVKQPGYLGHEHARGPDGVGITVSYWASEPAIRSWKQVEEHREAQRSGRERWYEDYVVRVARVERAYTLATSPRQDL